VAEFIRGQLALVAQLERAMIRTRVSGKAKRGQEGRHLGGRAPFGYRLGTTGRFVVDNGEAGVVRDVFRRAREGLGPGPIARRLNTEGVAGPSGRPWNRQTVTNMLRNPVYAGELHGVKGAQPAIVSRRVWNQAQAAMPRRVSRRLSEEELEVGEQGSAQ
jgi:DNA invertase Pin-like site-specific DNA recombinase